MKDVMVDLETLDSTPTSLILSIGAVEFEPNTGALGKEFYEVLSIESCAEHGLTVSTATKQWWSRQSPEARTVLDAAGNPGAWSLAMALGMFAGWISSCAPLGSVRVWGNGADFDNAILANAYRAIGQPLPWKFYNNRCFRTLKNMPGVRAAIAEPVRQGTFHNALDDAKHQARWAAHILQRLGVGVPEPENTSVFTSTHASIDADGKTTLGGFYKAGETPRHATGGVEAPAEKPVPPILKGEHLAKGCTKAPAGWHCTRVWGHTGPCAAVENVPAPAYKDGQGY